MPASNYQRIYSIVKRIPKGKVATYGQVARLAGLPGHARQVGYALHALTNGTTLPWHRVVNAKGQVSRRARSGGEITQRILLEEEGVGFDVGGRLSFKRAGWRTAMREPQG